MKTFKSILLVFLSLFFCHSCRQREHFYDVIPNLAPDIEPTTAIPENFLFGRWVKPNTVYPALQFGQDKNIEHTNRYFEAKSDSEPFADFKGEFEITDDPSKEVESPYGPNMLILKQEQTSSKSKDEVLWICARIEFKDANSILLSEFQIDKGKCPNISSDSKKILWERHPTRYN